MTLRQIRRQRPIRAAYPIRRLGRKVLEIFANCVEAFRIARETPDEFDWQAAAISAHLTPIVMRILASGLPEIEELVGLNSLVAFLELDVEEFISSFPEQVEDVINACANYTPLDPYWAEMEPVLIGHLQRMQGEERDAEGEEREREESDEERDEPMLIG